MLSDMSCLNCYSILYLSEIQPTYVFIGLREGYKWLKFVYIWKGINWNEGKKKRTKRSIWQACAKSAQHADSWQRPLVLSRHDGAESKGAQLFTLHSFRILAIISSIDFQIGWLKLHWKANSQTYNYHEDTFWI